MVTTSGTLPHERRGRNGSGMCYYEDVPQEREICWEPTVGYHEEIPDRMGEFIWSLGSGIGGHYILQVWKMFTETLVWKIYVRENISDGSN